jgi:hypothetical protein
MNNIDLRVILSIISIILIPALGYYLKSEIQKNLSAIKEWTSAQIDKVYEMLKRELDLLESRVLIVEKDQHADKAKHDLLILEMKHIDQKISSIDKKQSDLVIQLQEQHDSIIKILLKENLRHETNTNIK